MAGEGQGGGPHGGWGAPWQVRDREEVLMGAGVRQGVRDGISSRQGIEKRSIFALEIKADRNGDGPFRNRECVFSGPDTAAKLTTPWKRWSSMRVFPRDPAGFFSQVQPLKLRQNSPHR